MTSKVFSNLNDSGVLKGRLRVTQSGTGKKKREMRIVCDACGTSNRGTVAVFVSEKRDCAHTEFTLASRGLGVEEVMRCGENTNSSV